MLSRNRHKFAGVLFGLGILSIPAHSNQIWNWSGTASGYQMAGTISFSVIPNGLGYDLQMDITNTATAVPPNAGFILSGMYFDITTPGQGPLGMKSAVATSGLVDAANQTSPAPGTANTNVCAPGKGGTALNLSCASTIAGGWEAGYFAGGIGGGASATQHYAVGTSGQTGVFNGNAANVGNVNYGVAPIAGINTALANVGSMVPYTYNTLTIVLTGLSSSNVTIANVEAIYGGTPENFVNASAAPAPSVPEPGTWLSLCGGLGLLAWFRLRQRAGARS